MKRRQTRVRLERERVQKTRERQLSLRLSPGGFVFIGVSRRRPARNLRLATHCVHRRAVVQRAEPHRTGDGERRRLDAERATVSSRGKETSKRPGSRGAPSRPGSRGAARGGDGPEVPADDEGLLAGARLPEIRALPQNVLQRAVALEQVAVAPLFSCLWRAVELGKQLCCPGGRRATVTFQTVARQP